MDQNATSAHRALPSCQFPAVVRLYGSRGIPEMCSGAYVGGRVILTAAHCFDRGGYQKDRLVFEAETDTQAPQCESDADCPVETILGQPTHAIVRHADAFSDQGLKFGKKIVVELRRAANRG